MEKRLCLLAVCALDYIECVTYLTSEACLAVGQIVRKKLLGSNGSAVNNRLFCLVKNGYGQK